MNKIPLSNQKEKLVREDIEKYLMGQMKLQDIAIKRNLSLYMVGKIGKKVVYEKMNNYYCPNEYI